MSMGEIQFTGLSTGIDTGAIVQQLMAVESRRLYRYQDELAEQEKVRGALNKLEANLNDLRDAVEALSDADRLRVYQATSSNTDLLTADTSDKAFEASHSVVIDQLANPERWVQSGGLEYVDDYIGAGTFIYSYNGHETVITTSAETTLEDLQGLINNDVNNPGVTASVLNYSDRYHLVLNGIDAGSDYEISINASNTEVWQADAAFTNAGDDAGLGTLLTDLDQFGGTLAGDETIIISGAQHDGTAVNASFTITANTKLSHLVGEIEDAFGGTARAFLENGRLVLTDATSGPSHMTLTLSYNAESGSTSLALPTIDQTTEGGSVAASLAGFSATDFVETQSAQDSRIKVDGFPVEAEEWITRSSNTVDDVISGVTLHLHDAGTVQVGLTRDTESVEEKTEAMIDAYNTVMTFIKTNASYNEETGTAGLLMGDTTVMNLRDILRLPLIEQTDGFVVDLDTFLMPGQIGLEVDRDGLLGLDSTVFNEAVTEDYMGVLALIGADKTGNSSSDTIEFNGASSRYTAGGNYDVEISIVGGAITSARVKAESEATYRDATFEGNVVTGDSTLNDSGEPLYPENGLRLSIDLSQDGTFTATVRIKQGFAGTMSDTLDRILDANKGMLTLEQKSTDVKIDSLEDDIEAEEDRLSSREARLVAQYARLERTLNSLQSQMSALTAFL